MTTNLPAIQQAMKNPNIVDRINDRLGKKSGTFITSVLDLCGEDNKLAVCDPNLVIKESLKAAALDLPVNKNLGFAWVIPYNKKIGNKTVPIPAFQMGYRGYIQLAIRTGQYKHINADVVYDGEEIVEDRIKGTFTIEGKKKTDKVIGYFCYFELLNGFQKGIVWTKERMTAHAKKYSKSFNYSSSPWKSDSDAMGIKTMVLRLIPKFGIMSVQMSQAMTQDRADFKGFNPQSEIENNANQEIIDIPQTTTEPKDTEMSDAEKEEIKHEEMAEGPDY